MSIFRFWFVLLPEHRSLKYCLSPLSQLSTGMCISTKIAICNYGSMPTVVEGCIKNWLKNKLHTSVQASISNSEQSSWETHNSPASQEIFDLLWNPKVHCFGHESPPLDHLQVKFYMRYSSPSCILHALSVSPLLIWSQWFYLVRSKT